MMNGGVYNLYVTCSEMFCIFVSAKKNHVVEYFCTHWLVFQQYTKKVDEFVNCLQMRFF